MKMGTKQMRGQGMLMAVIIALCSVMQMKEPTFAVSVWENDVVAENAAADDIGAESADGDAFASADDAKTADKDDSVSVSADSIETEQEETEEFTPADAAEQKDNDTAVSAQDIPAITADADTAAETAVAETDYKETEDGLEIYTLAGLEYFRDSVNKGTIYEGKIITLKSDIDMKSGGYGVEKNQDGSLKSWTPIGDIYNAFQGKFDGGGNKIKNIYINTTNFYQGLFGCVEDGTIKNVTIEGGSITGGAYVGGVIGKNEGSLEGPDMESGLVANCHSSASVTATSYFYSYVGGIVGWSQYSDIRACHNTGKIYGTDIKTGGVAGIIRNSVMDECSNAGSVKGKRDVGGVVSSSVDSLVMNCYNTGSVEDDGEEYASQYVGGVVGGSIGSGSSVELCHNKNGTVKGIACIGGVVGENQGEVTRCSNSGSVEGKKYVGGVVGKNQDLNDSTGASSNNDVIVQDCYNTGNVEGESYVGGVAGESSHSSQDKIISCHNTGSIKGIGCVGGVAGLGIRGTMEDCYNIGSVAGTKSSVGGVIGQMSSYAQRPYIMKNCYTVGGTISNGEVVNNVFGTAFLDYREVENCYYFLDKTDDGSTLEIMTTYPDAIAQDLSNRIEIYPADTDAAVSSCTYSILGGNQQMKAVINGGMLTIPADAAAGTYTLDIGADVTTTDGSRLLLLLPFTVSIKKASPLVTAPTANSRTYDGSAQELVNAGSSTGGTLQYSMSEGGTYSSVIPAQTQAGEYTVYYRVDGGSNYENTDVACVNVTIAKKTLTARIEGTATSKSYDGTTAVTEPGGLSVSLNGIIEGDENKVAAEASYEYNSAKVTEAHTIVAKNITLSGEKAENYQLSDTPATISGNITKSSPTIALKDSYSRSRTYNGKTIANPAAGDLMLTGALYSDVVFSWDKTPLNAGIYTLTAQIADTPDHGSAVVSFKVSVGKAKQPSSFPPGDIQVSNKCTKVGSVSLQQGWEWRNSVRNKKLKVGSPVTAAAVYNGADKGNYEAETVTVTITRKPGTPVMKSLRNQQGKKVTVTIKKKISGAAGYQVAYAVKSSMKGGKVKTFKTFKKTGFILKNLKKNKKYYIRVRAYTKKNGRTTYGEWSKAKKIKVIK